MASTYLHLKKRIAEKICLGDNMVVSEIMCRNPMFVGATAIHYQALRITDNDDVEFMFNVHKSHSSLSYIELYVTFEMKNPTSNFELNYPSSSSQHQNLPQQQYNTQHCNPSSSSSQPHYNPSSQPFQSQWSQNVYEPPQLITQPHPSQPETLNDEINIFTSQFQDQPTDEVQDDEDNDDEELLAAQNGDENEEDDDDDLPQLPILPIRASYNPPRSMRNVNDDHSTELYHSMALPVDQGIAPGMQFHNKNDCILAIKYYHMKKSTDYIVKKSDPERYVIKCKDTKCGFKLRASWRKKTDKWEIGNMNDHTCVSTEMTQDHHKLSYNVICESVKSLLYMDASITVKVIIAHIREKFNYTVSYRKAWRARNKAIESIYGNWEESYEELPQWLMVMEKDLPGTIIDFQSDPSTEVANETVFKRLFWAFRPCISGFEFCKPIVQIDATWLYGKYKGTLLLAVAQDGNNKIFPIAFAIVEGETKEAWSFFLKNLRQHVTPQENICLISDRHVSIKSAYDDPQNGWHDAPTSHVYCVRHIAQNFMRSFKDGELKKKVECMGYAMNIPTFEYYRSEIAVADRKALAWVDNIPKQKWTQSHDDGRRWGHMTSNLVESQNNVYKGIRGLPITAIVKASYYRLAALFAKRGHEAAARVNSGEPFSENSMKYLRNEVIKSNSHHVTQFDRDRYTFSVRETIDHKEGLPKGEYKVDLQNKWCDCGRFRALHLPCSHVIAACSSFCHDYKTFVDNKFTNECVYAVYNIHFDVVHHQTYWPNYEGPKVVPNKSMRRAKKGRPPITRIRTEMDDVETERRCGVCRMPGHSRKDCINIRHQ
ncbi:uncharacterized protein [Medicago truncatula]|uniref:uncharacterized protein n=2 Tax=Medicago truncatula TaxID=3880 RepID=UPI000D2F1A3C|nr:uncharacterized protein LOC112417450 [Medicago truncatula]